jgi:hypothetical protein
MMCILLNSLLNRNHAPVIESVGRLARMGGKGNARLTPKKFPTNVPLPEP